MKKSIVAAALLLVVVGAATAQARVDFHVNIDIPVPVPVVSDPGYQSYPAYPAYAPQVVVEEAPRFIYSPNLGFYVSVGTPYDIVYVDRSYYQYRGGSWYLSPSYRGPWTSVSQRWLPSGLHRHKYEQIRHYRDREYRSYLNDRQHYRGSWYRPAGGHGPERYERHIERRDDRRDYRRDHRYDRRDHRVDRKDRKDDRKDHRDDRKDDRKDRKDDRRDHRDDRRDGRGH